MSHARRNGSGWQAFCPAHADKNPSLSVTERDGKILLHCFAGCTVGAICSALGIAERDLFLDTTDSERRIGATYDYVDEQGKLLFQVVRFEPKEFRQRRPDGQGGWIWNLNGIRRVLYRLPEVLTAKFVLTCEGEKDCETARKLDLVATTNPGGAGKWRSEHSESLRGKHVVIIPDQDEAGRKHGQQVAASLHLKAASVKILNLPPPLKDMSELPFSREALAELVAQAPEWTDN